MKCGLEPKIDIIPKIADSTEREGLWCVRRGPRGRARSVAGTCDEHVGKHVLILVRIKGPRLDDTEGKHDYVIASVKIYPRAILGTPGTSGYRVSYKRVLRVVPHKPLRPGIF